MKNKRNSRFFYIGLVCMLATLNYNLLKSRTKAIDPARKYIRIA